MPGHESDERRAYENYEMKKWFDSMPTRHEDYDNPRRDSEADAYHDYRMKEWASKRPKRNDYDYR